MKNRWLIACLVLVTVIFAASFYALWSNQPNNPLETETLFQLETFNTFCEGNYDGFMTYKELAEHGDFGIGTFDELDGEMIALDGIYYQVPIDGNPKQVDPSMTTPYATVTFFEADETQSVTGPANYSDLQTTIQNLMPVENAIYAIKVTGNYSFAKTRSVPPQTKPYPTIEEVVKNQTVFDLNNVSATAVGFWFPDSMDGVDYAGFHLHLITDDFSAGGHLLEFILENGTIQIDQTNNYRLVLP